MEAVRRVGGWTNEEREVEAVRRVGEWTNEEREVEAVRSRSLVEEAKV